MRSFFLTGLLGIVLAGCTGTRPSSLGVNDGKIAPCPPSPNCVSSQSTDSHAVAPLRYAGDPQAAMSRLRKIVQDMPRAQVITASDRYLYAEFTSRIFRFVDDVEFVIDDREKRIDVRSASRLGHSDLGVNRERVETIREKWTARE